MEKVISIIIVIVLYFLLSTLYHYLKDQRAKNKSDTFFEKAFTVPKRWFHLYQNVSHQTTDGLNSPKFLAILANALYFPDYESFTNRKIQLDSIPSFISEVNERFAKYPNDYNNEVINAVIKIFTKISKEDIDKIKIAINAASEAYKKLCELDLRALNVAFNLSRLIGNNMEKERSELQKQFNSLHNQVCWEFKAYYISATIEAKQTVLRLGIPSEKQKGLASFQELMTNTITITKNNWNELINKENEVFASEGWQREKFAEWLITILLKDSSRWAAYPLLTGEYHTLLVPSPDSLTNYLFIRRVNEPPTQHTVILPKIRTVETINVKQTNYYKIAFINSQSIQIPSINSLNSKAILNFVQLTAEKEIHCTVQEHLNQIEKLLYIGSNSL